MSERIWRKIVFNYYFFYPKLVIKVGDSHCNIYYCHKNLIVVMLTIFWVSFWRESKMGKKNFSGRGKKILGG